MKYSSRGKWCSLTVLKMPGELLRISEERADTDREGGTGPRHAGEMTR